MRFLTEKKLAEELCKSALEVNGEIVSETDASDVADAIFHLKLDKQWLDDQNLIGIRCKYFFEPHMTDTKHVMAFLSYPFFVRDILEKKYIDGYLHSPVIFVTKPIASFLFKEYSVQILLDSKKLQEQNKHVKWVSLGGCLVPNVYSNIDIDGCLVGTSVGPDENIKRRIDRFRLVKDMERDSSLIIKSAMKTKNPETGIWEISEHERDLPPGTRILDKKKRTYAIVRHCEPGINGNVEIEYAGGNRVVIKQDEFDLRFSRI